MIDHKSQENWQKSPERYYDNPPPDIRIAGSKFVLTGTFAYGERSDIENQIQQLGGLVTHNPAKNGCYVVVGTLPTKEWLTKDAGLKLIGALQLRDEEDCFVRIISEDHFIATLLAMQSEEIQPAFAEALHPQPPIPWGELLPLWFTSVTDLFPNFNYGWYPTVKYLIVHEANAKSKQICRIYHDRTGLPIAIAVAGHKEMGLAFRRNLPQEALEQLKQYVQDLVTVAEAMPVISVKQPLLSPEELQRRNTERKAAMRAQPVTPEVLEAANYIIAGLSSAVPKGAQLEGRDMAKYYAIYLVPGECICRLHYKTKNKYIEINGEKPVPVKDFSQLGEFLERMAMRLHLI